MHIPANPTAEQRMNLIIGDEMTPALHAELTSLIGRFHSEGISDEEWALLQIHMAYCADCENAFLALQSAASSLSQPKSFN